ncbi:MAG: hypothetical protein RMN25_12075 [Anaerolineae bacterium]|nr:hypothetical protein [Thermoflexales bacterium]MDW8408508.1 hypothetical protein [Anaerolineae bacterium]
MSQGKTLGLILTVAGAAIFALVALWAIVNNDPAMTASAKVLAVFFGLVISAPLVGFGVYVLNKAQAEAGEEKIIAKQRKLLNMVITRGQVNIPEVALELQATRDETKHLIYDLIGKELFSGYVDWEGGVLYSSDAGKLKQGGQCPKCGGALQLAGKGLVKCPYCGAEIFLSQ